MLAFDNTPFMATEKQRYFGLDFVRATAILFVIFHHSLSFTHAPTWLGFFGPMGSLGVEALLVLSGYLIGQGLIRKVKQDRFSQIQHLWQFYVKRWLRTLPPYYVYLFVMAALFAPMVQQLIDHKEYFFFMQNFAWRMPPFYAQTWTLALLEFFYFIFPLILFLSSKVLRHHLAVFLIPSILLMGIPLVCRALHSQVEDIDGFGQVFCKLIIFHIDTPITGVMMALIESEFPAVWAWILRHYQFGLVAVAASATYFLSGYPGLSSSHWLQVFFFPIISVTIALNFPLLCSWKENFSRFGTAMSSISQVSYSLYVSHYFALSIGLVLLIVTGISSDHWMVSYPLFIVLVAIIGYPTYLLTEEPFMRLRERKSSSRSLFLPVYGAMARFFKAVATNPLSLVYRRKPSPAQMASE